VPFPSHSHPQVIISLLYFPPVLFLPTECATRAHERGSRAWRNCDLKDNRGCRERERERERERGVMPCLRSTIHLLGCPTRLFFTIFWPAKLGSPPYSSRVRPGPLFQSGRDHRTRPNTGLVSRELLIRMGRFWRSPILITDGLIKRARAWSQRAGEVREVYMHTAQQPDNNDS
jgi:hypothetical protein